MNVTPPSAWPEVPPLNPESPFPWPPVPPVAVLSEITEFVIAGPVWAKSEIAPYAVPPDLPSPLPTASAPLPPVAELCVMLLAAIVSFVETPSIWTAPTAVPPFAPGALDPVAVFPVTLTWSRERLVPAVKIPPAA